MRCQNCQTKHKSAFCPNCGTAANVTKKSKSNKIAWITLVIIFAIGLAVSGIIMFSPKNKIDLESNNVVEDVVEYKINRVFISDFVESLFKKETYAYTADVGEDFVLIDAEVKNLKSTGAKANDLINLSLTINEKEYSAYGYIITEHSADADKTIPSGETARVYYAVSIPEGEDTGSMTLKAVCGEKTASCEISVSMYEERKESLLLNNEYTDYSTKSITIEKVWFTDRVEPTDYEKYDYYDYYPAEYGKTILAVKMKVKNLGNEPLYLNDIAGIESYHTQGTSEGFYCMEGVDGTKRTFEEYEELLSDKPSIAPQETETVYCLIQVPESVKNGTVELETYLVGTHYYYTVQ